MGRKQIITLAAISVLVIFCICAVAIDDIFGRNGFTLGLDLRGGVYLEYRADFSGNSSDSNADRLVGARNIIEDRVNSWGLTEAEVNIVGEDRIVVQLPGYENFTLAKNMVGSTAELVFMEQTTIGNTSVSTDVNVSDTMFAVASVSGFGVGDMFYIGSGDTVEMQTISAIDAANLTLTVTSTSGFFFNHSAGEQVTNYWTPATGLIDGEKRVLTGKYLLPNCVGGLNPSSNEPEVQFEWNSEGAELFSQITGRLVGKPLGIALDNKIISSPKVEAQIGDRGVITGLTLDEARTLAIQLNTGALPITLHEVRTQNIAATLSENTLSDSLLAGLIGLVMIFIFMTAYYRLPGFVSCIALLVYGVVVLAIFKLLPVTMSAAGIAGVVISTGMAIDANILIFERTKEELRLGHALGPAIDIGFHRAWLAIRDGHISTIISCIILVWFGRSFGAVSVTGFALTLGIGVAMSLFTAMVVTRSFMRIVMLTPVSKVKWLFHS